MGRKSKRQRRQEREERKRGEWKWATQHRRTKVETPTKIKTGVLDVDADGYSLWCDDESVTSKTLLPVAGDADEEAEYSALAHGLEKARNEGVTHVQVNAASSFVADHATQHESGDPCPRLSALKSRVVGLLMLFKRADVAKGA